MYDIFNGKMQPAVCGLNLHTKNTTKHCVHGPESEWEAKKKSKWPPWAEQRA
jgi:hypothetical protein